jgi:hypothetical protein
LRPDDLRLVHAEPYRLGRSRPQQIFKLRGLAAPRYEVLEDGRPRGVFTARHLASGLPVTLDAERGPGTDRRGSLSHLTLRPAPEKMKVSRPSCGCGGIGRRARFRF